MFNVFNMLHDCKISIKESGDLVSVATAVLVKLRYSNSFKLDKLFKTSTDTIEWRVSEKSKWFNWLQWRVTDKTKSSLIDLQLLMFRYFKWFPIEF